MRNFIGSFFALIFVFQTSTVFASDVYFSVHGGATILNEADQTDAADTTAFSTATDFDTGYNVGGAVGVKLSNFRFEFELGYSQVGADSMEITNDAGIGVALGLGSLTGLKIDLDGDVNTLSYMANAYYDFKNKTNFTPFVGFGVGGATVYYNDIKTSGVLIVDDNDTVFAYKLGAGLAYKISESLNLTGDYHYLATTDLEFTDSTGAKFDSEYESHNVNLGIRYTF
jgi:opacity protein-like surface antigen